MRKRCRSRSRASWSWGRCWPRRGRRKVSLKSGTEVTGERNNPSELSLAYLVGQKERQVLAGNASSEAVQNLKLGKQHEILSSRSLAQHGRLLVPWAICDPSMWVTFSTSD